MHKSTGAVLGAAILLSGCSFASNSLWPSLTGDEPSGKPPDRISIPPSQISIPPSQAELNKQPTFSAPSPPTGPVAATRPVATTGQPTGTLVGLKVVPLKRDLKR